jgi:hypothetical protein
VKIDRVIAKAEEPQSFKGHYSTYEDRLRSLGEAAWATLNRQPSKFLPITPLTDEQFGGGQLSSATQLGNFKPLVFGAFRAAANIHWLIAKRAT